MGRLSTRSRALLWAAAVPSGPAIRGAAAPSARPRRKRLPRPQADHQATRRCAERSNRPYPAARTSAPSPQSCATPQRTAMERPGAWGATQVGPRPTSHATLRGAHPTCRLEPRCNSQAAASRPHCRASTYTAAYHLRPSRPHHTECHRPTRCHLQSLPASHNSLCVAASHAMATENPPNPREGGPSHLL